jgi:threonine/homoserine/homoserine lactone efflux protein
MTHQLLLALTGFAFVTSVTPGPNNMMLLASGGNFGFLRTVPHMLGVSFGLAPMIFLFGLGLTGTLHSLPQALILLKAVSLGYMLWLAWKIANAAAPQGGKAAGRPLRFIQAVAFQWVNPKTWMMVIGAVTAYAPGAELGSLAVVVAVFCVVNLPCIALWAAIGDGLRGWLAQPARLRAFNWTMAGLLMLSLLPVLKM